MGVATKFLGEGARGILAGQLEKVAEAVFGEQLAALGLGVGQIETQGIDELQASLERVNDAIGHPEAFGSYGVAFTAKAGTVSAVLAGSNTDATVTVGVLPLLLQRKKLILERIATLRPEEQLASVREAVAENIDDGALKQQVLGLIDERLVVERERTEQLKQEADAVLLASAEGKRFEIEMKERKFEIYKSMLERETVAGVVGPILLLLLAATLIVAMFTHTAISNPVSDSFLLILGYFFGQATTRDRAPSKEQA
jgi:hypothetical protein